MISVLNIFTIINLTLLGALLFFKKNNSIATKVLGLIIFIPATPFASNYFLYSGLLNKYPVLNFICLNFLWAPFVFWYVLLMLGEEVKINFKQLIHIVPYFMYVCSYAFLLTRDSGYIQNFLTNVYNGNFPWQLMAINTMLLVQTLGYLIYSYFKVNRYIRGYEKKGIEEGLISARVKWVKMFVQILLCLNIIGIVIYSVFPMRDATYLYTPLLYDVAFYVVIYGAIHSSSILSASEFQNYAIAEQENKEKYASSSIQPEQLEQSYQKLLDCLRNEKPYLKPELSLNDLSSQINVSQHFLSQLVNQKLNMSFSELINSYRIEEAKLKLKDIKQTKHSIEGIGLVCGFGSPASFYRAFKKNTGFTPSQYLNQQ